MFYLFSYWYLFFNTFGASYQYLWMKYITEQNATEKEKIIDKQISLDFKTYKEFI